MQLKFAVFLLLIPFTFGVEIYVDNSLASDCDTYSTANRDCNGTEPAYNTITEAADIAAAGDTVFIREGTYTEQLIPANSGTASAPITYANFQDENAIISGTSLRPAIIISDREYLILDGLIVDNVNRWLYALNTHHCILKNNEFTRAIDPGHSQKACLFFQEATHNKIYNNHIEDCAEDNIALIKSDYNIVENNTVIKGIHTLWAIKCGNNNIIRGNYFHNDIEKIGEIFDCHDVGFDHEFNNILNQTKYNIVENNVFAYVPPHIDHSPYSGIQFAGQRSIIRNNIFYDNTGPGLQMTLYTFAEAHYNIENRIYNNVFYNNSFGGISITGSQSYEFYDNIFKNNILLLNDFDAHDDRWTWYRELDGHPVQLMNQRLNSFIFENNNFYSREDEYLITYGDRDSSSNPPQQNLEWWHLNHPNLFIDNTALDPMFYSEDDRDFHLLENSPMIDSGVFLTYTTSSGSGTELSVEDVLYFYDGFGIENGDVIQLDTELASVVDIDYGNNILRLDRSLTWTAGQGVSLPYEGSPNMGALDYDPDYVPVCNPITNTQMLDFINQWMQGQLNTIELMTAIGEWKNGC